MCLCYPTNPTGCPPRDQSCNPAWGTCGGRVIYVFVLLTQPHLDGYSPVDHSCNLAGTHVAATDGRRSVSGLLTTLIELDDTDISALLGGWIGDVWYIADTEAWIPGVK